MDFLYVSQTDKTQPALEHLRTGIIVLIAAACIISACSSSNYTLPPPGEQTAEATGTTDADKKPGKQEPKQSQTRAFLDVRKQARQLYKLLEQQRFREAEAFFSQQTRNFLTMGKTDRTVASTLAEQTIQLPGGDNLEIGPPEQFFLGGDIETIRDSVDGQSDSETDERKVIYVKSAGDGYERVVFIREGGKWVLHKTSGD